MLLKNISVTTKNTAITIGAHALFHEHEKKPHGYVVETITKEKDQDGINKIMPVFLPYTKDKMHELDDCAMNSSFFMVEVSFENLIIHNKKSGGYYATATDLNIIESED